MHLLLFTAIFKNVQTGHILKPIFDQRGCREKRFYELLFKNEEVKDEKLIQDLRRFVPAYFGTILINDVQFIVLENITCKWPTPSLMDVKIGIHTHDRDSSKQKMQYEHSKNSLNR